MASHLPSGKHTQGDWHLSGQFDADTTVEVVVGDVPGEEMAICEIVPIGEEWSEEEIANAHLLANASRMLASLNEFCRVVASEPQETLVAALRRAYDQARLAIAKAEDRA